MDKFSGRRNNLGHSVLGRYKVGKTLGIGAFGKVKLAVHILTGLKVAIKILDRQLINSEAVKVRREINIMRQLFHPHIVRLFEVIDTPSHVYVVMEYMSSGELFYYLTEKGRLREDEALYFFQQIISGIEYCHQNLVVHRDLKPENLLLDSKCNIKIADFGFANVMRDGHFLKTSCGSQNYAAPEIICGKLYAGPEVDVWSCGVILYALLCGRLPFDDDNLARLRAKIKSGVYPVANHLSQSARDLISRILVVDPMKRISIPEILRHPWFQKHLPLYIAKPSPKILHRTEEVNIDVVKDMVQMGFDICEVIGSLQNNQQNEVTVTYSMLLHSHHSPGQDRNHETSEIPDRVQTYTKQSVLPGHNNWTLGFKSRASPRQTMSDVLKVFHSLNVKWKRIGQYNVKCLFSPPPLWDPLSTAESPMGSRSINAIKFEIQLYKASGELYVLDLQQLSGPPFLFLDICASFGALVA